MVWFGRRRSALAFFGDLQRQTKGQATRAKLGRAQPPTYTYISRGKMGKTARTLTSRPRALAPTNPTRRPRALGGPGRGRGRITARREAIRHRALAATAAVISVIVAVTAPRAGVLGKVTGNGEETHDKL